MKKYFLLGLIVAIAPSVCFGAGARYTQLVREKQRKMAELEKCMGSTQGLKIAGLSTIGLTAVGVAGNIAEAKKLDEYDTNLKLADKKIATAEEDIAKEKEKIEKIEAEKKAAEEAEAAAAAQKKAEEEARALYQTNCSATNGNINENGICICSDQKPSNDNGSCTRIEVVSVQPNVVGSELTGVISTNNNLYTWNPVTTNDGENSTVSGSGSTTPTDNNNSGSSIVPSASAVNNNDKGGNFGSNGDNDPNGDETAAQVDKGDHKPCTDEDFRNANLTGATAGWYYNGKCVAKECEANKGYELARNTKGEGYCKKKSSSSTAKTLSNSSSGGANSNSKIHQNKINLAYNAIQVQARSYDGVCERGTLSNSYVRQKYTCSTESTGNWTAKFDGYTANGGSYCAGNKTSESFKSGTPSGSGNNCWCKVTNTVGNNSWVYSSHVPNCRADCAYHCAYELGTYQPFRQEALLY